jgi:outer membrane protein TolC
VTLNLNYFLSRQSNPTESDWNAVFSANLPLFSAGVIHADVRTAWSRFRQAVLFESLVRRRVKQEVETAVQNLSASRLRLAELKVQVAAAEQSLRQAEESYKVGFATNLERVVAQNLLLEAQLELTSERFEQRVFDLNLLRVTGRLSVRLPGEPTAPGSRPATTGAATQPAS